MLLESILYHADFFMRLVVGSCVLPVKKVKGAVHELGVSLLAHAQDMLGMCVLAKIGKNLSLLLGSRSA